jgi:hypothetical protein
MSRLTIGLKMLSTIIEKLESGEYDLQGKHSKAIGTFHHIRRHYNVPTELESDIYNGYLRVK